MAATEHAITTSEPMELPSLPPNQGLEALKDIIFGSSAGMAGKLIEYPFDTVKVRLQSQPEHLPLRYAGPLDCFRQSLRADGFRGLYRGISAPMAGAAVETSCLFFSYRLIQDALRATVYPGVEHLPFFALIASGALSGSVTSLVLTPIELVKCRMQVPAESTGLRPAGPMAIVAGIFRHEGLAGYWRGQTGTLIRETGGSAAWFGGYEGVSSLFRKYNKSNPQLTSDSLPIHQQIIAGATAGISYNFLFYPADTIKSRMQTVDLSRLPAHAQQQTFWGETKALWRQQGLKGMYRGPPVSELLTRLKLLEEEVEQLRSPRCNPVTDHTPDLDDHPNLQKTVKKTELLVLKEGKSRYVGDEASVTLGQKISELRDIIESSSDEESYSPDVTYNPITLPEGGLLGYYESAWSLDYFRFHYYQPARLDALWKTYQEDVAPLIVILHQATMARIVQDARAGNDLTPSDEALLFSVCYAAVTSMRAHTCPSILDTDHDTAIQDCKNAVSQGLRRANFISSQCLSALQAAVLFLLCYRVGGDTRLVWAESAVVIRVAQAQGVHRDGQNFSLPPLETEMRRRLWWHICMLDMLSSGDQGVDTQIRSEMFDTQFPSNVDDDDITLYMTDPPLSKTGFTNTTMCIMNSQIMTEMLWPRQGGSFDMSTHDRENLVTTLGKTLHEQYIDNFNLEIPIHWVTATIVRLQLSKAWLATHFQSEESDEKTFRHDDRVFETAVELVQFSYLLQTNEGTLQWSWLCKSYKEWHVVAFILSELCLRPLSPETDHAWDVVTKMYGLWQQDMPRTDAMLQKPLDRLMARTASSRAGQQGQDGQTPFSGETLSDMSDVSFGLGNTDSDSLFSGLDWLSESLF
ncbi:Transcription factor, fungi [Penicillium italicum]|uniref:Transcription factor, fungi n=1 Tax=Penicillium italicum TaxID=40296 RepID=A0A0A2KKU1_PENIT|nr:Transcription factor, fungi [Penicillium italicum]